MDSLVGEVKYETRYLISDPGSLRARRHGWLSLAQVMSSTTYLLVIDN